MRQYLAPFGFDTRRVTRPIIAHGIDAGDQVVLLQPATNFDEDGDSYGKSRAKEAVASLVEFFGQIDDEIRVVSVPITSDPFETAIREVSALITDPTRASRVGIAQNEAEGVAPPLGTKAVETILCPGGGPRELLFAAHTAASAHPHHISHTILMGDLTNQPMEIELPRVNPHVPERARETFQALIDVTEPIPRTRIDGIDDGISADLSVTEISQATGQSKSTVGRHLDALESEDVVKTERDGKQRRARLTLTAELLLRDQQASRFDRGADERVID